MGTGTYPGRNGITAATAKQMQGCFPSSRQLPMDGAAMRIRSMLLVYCGIIREGIYLQDCLGTARWCRWQWHSLEMKAVRSSGRGMGFHIEKNDVPALSAGARNSAV